MPYVLRLDIPEAVLRSTRSDFECEPEAVSIRETTAGELRIDSYDAPLLHWSAKVYDVRDGANHAVYTVDGSLLWKK